MFHVAFVIKRLLYIKFRVFRKKKATACWQVWVAQRFSLSRQSFLVPCHDSGFCVMTGFGLSRVFLGRDRGCPLS